MEVAYSTVLSSTKQVQLVAHGPYNPAVVIQMKIFKKILDLEFIDMVEIIANTDIQLVGCFPPITTISQWRKKFSIMAANPGSNFPEKAPKLFAYQISIIRANKNYEGK